MIRDQNQTALGSGELAYSLAQSTILRKLGACANYISGLSRLDQTVS